MKELWSENFKAADCNRGHKISHAQPASREGFRGRRRREEEKKRREEREAMAVQQIHPVPGPTRPQPTPKLDSGTKKI